MASLASRMCPAVLGTARFNSSRTGLYRIDTLRRTNSFPCNSQFANLAISRRFQSTSIPTPRRGVASRIVRAGLFVFAIGFSFVGGGLFMFINGQPSPPADSFTQEIEAQLQAHPLVKSMLADTRFTASRPHQRIPAMLRPYSFTGGDMISPTKLVVPPIIFTTTDGSELVSVAYLGKALCGHPGVVHGGMLATMMDEGLARTCFGALPNKVGMTANLNIDYRAPCKAEQFVVLKAKTTKVDGRKAWVEGRLETLPADGSQGRLLVEGRGLFVEPKNAALQGKLMKITS